MILSSDEQACLAGTLVEGGIGDAPSDIVLTPPEVVAADFPMGGTMALFGFLVFDDLTGDLMDPSLFEDELGELVAQVSSDGPLFDPEFEGPVSLNTVVGEVFGCAYINLEGGPPSSKIPLPAALPMLGLGLGLPG